MAKAKIEDKDIQAALALLDVANDAHWVDGKPNLQMLQEALGPELTAADVERNITDKKSGLVLDRIGIARSRGIILSLPEPAPPNESAILRSQVTTADSKLAEIEVKLGENSGKREALQKETDALNAERDRLVRIKQGGNQVSSADAVKAIQAQSLKAAEDRKAQTLLMAASMRAAGINPQFASKLDQDLAMRKRDPEHAQRHAAHIAQQVQERNAARG